MPAAQAGIVSIFNGTNSGGLAGTAAYWCGAADSTSPCVYGRTNGFGVVTSSDSDCAAFTNTSDCIHVEPNAAVTVTGLSRAFPINLVRVTVTRPVSMTLTQFVGLSKFNVSASATAAIRGRDGSGSHHHYASNKPRHSQIQWECDD